MLAYKPVRQLNRIENIADGKENWKCHILEYENSTQEYQVYSKSS